ncbi:MAG: T9SS type A sorting domain-containing protein [Ignavibacteriales bacterium]|nr:MAG: T9SS type A sorting domain-containing protein [Ignavibacteriales bacterium]
MKLFVVIFLLMLASKLIAQDLLGYREIYTLTENAGATFHLTALGAIWGHDFEISDSFCSYSLRDNQITVPSYNTGPTYGWDNVVLSCIAPNLPPFFGYSIYKVSIAGTRFVFYFDTRDCDYDGSYPCGNDFYLSYNYSLNTLTISTEGTCSDKAVTNNSYINIWDINEKTNPPLVDHFENFWQNCLVLIPSQSGNHPRLVWGPHPTLTDVVGYRVYRKYGTTNFVPIATTDFDEYYYTDTELTLDFVQGGTNAYYYLKAIVIHESESEATNTVVANIDGQSPEKQISSKSIIDDFQINNYPNPFNPSTIISYSIPERSNIQIKVYDILGREIQELVNELKEAGEHNIQFNAESLSSGVYIYSITVSNGNSILFRESKQMILMK